MTSAFLQTACTPEPEPRSVVEFVDDPIALEAVLSRCNADRSRTLGDPECQNAREAAHRISVAEEAERKRRLEAESQRKLAERRRRQREIEAARAKAEEDARLAEEARLLEQLRQGLEQGTTEANSGTPTGPGDESSAGGVVGPAEEQPQASGEGRGSEEQGHILEGRPPAPAPAEEDRDATPADSAAGTEPSDLESIRRELERRNTQN